MFVCVQVISAEKSGNHIFRLTGPGADQYPKGLFIIDIDTGEVSVSRSLDREATDSYQVCVCVCVYLPFSPWCPSGNSFIHRLPDTFIVFLVTVGLHVIPVLFIDFFLFNEMYLW